MIHSAIATSFADPADVARYVAAKAAGKTEREALSVGDNGVGYWGDNTKLGSGPACALSPETMKALWGSVAAAHLKQVRVSDNAGSVVVLVKDTLTHNSNRIDLNPDAVHALGWAPPLKQLVTWETV